MGNQASKDRLMDYANHNHCHIHQEIQLEWEYPTPVSPHSYIKKKKKKIEEAIIISPTQYQFVLADHISPLISLSAAASLKQRTCSVIQNSQQKKREEELWVYEYGAENERDRQTRQHYVLKLVFNGNIHVQLNNPERILESACGVGLWSIEMAQAYPNCQVIGIDIIPPSEKEGWTQSSKSIEQRIQFQYSDILLNPISFPNDYFDFIYQRDVATVVPFTVWPKLISEFFRILKPGGQIQLVEYDLLFKNPGPVLTQVNEYYRIAASAIDVNPDYTFSLPDYLKEAGFTNIEIKTYDIPIGEWPATDLEKQYGYLYKEQMRALFKSMKRWWCSEIKVLSKQEYDRVCLEALDEFEDFHSYACWKIFTATKKK
ncbi:S-adenosyl-L-methionine-dependent methyltransferase [Cokeromyces recurvatus]|uniref:S-adenosyl-L-methionine-dependent methyltransferase n=1 Tax=Cokeromyces recurvatus TaxID=90255 RepID=UPI0022209AD6|nr:S-adenosyl-L-methionine-dependent methyltransferase [Cokeromyces recurvatus]KAI7904165.1 S-adenosyl-L-methionine-dependent methyltransferase [Cokeromyces recurvatus]